MRVPPALTCELCGRTAEEPADGWRAYLTLEEDDSEAVAVFCPACADREFSPEAEAGDARRPAEG